MSPPPLLWKSVSLSRAVPVTQVARANFIGPESRTLGKIKMVGRGAFDLINARDRVSRSNLLVRMPFETDRREGEREWECVSERVVRVRVRKSMRRERE